MYRLFYPHPQHSVSQTEVQDGKFDENWSVANGSDRYAVKLFLKGEVRTQGSIAILVESNGQLESFVPVTYVDLVTFYRKQAALKGC